MQWTLIAAAVVGLLGVTASARDATSGQSWTLSGAKLVTARKGDTSPSQSSEFTVDKPISTPIVLSPGESLYLYLTFKAGDKPAVPHQAFLYMQQVDTGLETFFPIDITSSSAKGKLEISPKDLAPNFIASPSPLALHMVIGGFTPDIKSVFFPVAQIQPNFDPSAIAAAGKSLGDLPVKYGALPELMHTFRPEPRNPPKALSLVFLVAVGTSLVGLFVAWATLGGNVSSLPTAFSTSPISHPVFIGSLLTLEGIFVMYYLKWSLFKTLAAALCVAPVAFLSGSRALREVRGRRVRGDCQGALI